MSWEREARLLVRSSLPEKPRAALPDLVGGFSTNSPPSKRIGDSDVLLGGCDTLVVSCYVSWSSDSFARLSASLDAAKEEAQHSRDRLALRDLQGFRFVHPVVVGSGGAGKGGGFGPYYRWVFSHLGVRFFVSSQPEFVSTCPNVIVEFGSLAMLNLGGSVAAAYEFLCSVLSDLGASLTSAKPSRVDLFVDVRGDFVGWFGDAVQSGCWVSRVRSAVRFDSDWRSALHEQIDALADSSLESLAAAADSGELHATIFASRRRLESVTVGRETLLRVYNKRIELRHQPDKRSRFLASWGCDVSEDVTRFEFQIRREALKERGIDTMDDLISSLGLLVAWLTSAWSRVTLSRPTRGNAARSVVHPLWIDLASAFIDWCGGTGEVSEPQRSPVAVSALCSQAAGVIKSIIAYSGPPASSAEEVVADAVMAAVSLCFGVGSPGWHERVHADVVRRAEVLGAVRAGPSLGGLVHA